jgi:hypothetical protein
MKTHSRLFIFTAAFALLSLILVRVPGIAHHKTAAASAKAGFPVLLTSCGQSPGFSYVEVSLKGAKVDWVQKLDATAADLAKSQFKSIIIVTGASLKGMGAAGIAIEDEIARIKALIAAAKKQNIKIIGAHVEGMKRRAQGASPGDNTDELSIDAVCPFSDLLVVKKEGDEDGRFTTISKGKGIPLITYEKNMDLQGVLKDLFGK